MLLLIPTSYSTWMYWVISYTFFLKESEMKNFPVLTFLKSFCLSAIFQNLFTISSIFFHLLLPSNISKLVWIKLSLTPTMPFPLENHHLIDRTLYRTSSMNRFKHRRRHYTIYIPVSQWMTLCYLFMTADSKNVWQWA